MTCHSLDDARPRKVTAYERKICLPPRRAQFSAHSLENILFLWYYRNTVWYTFKNEDDCMKISTKGRYALRLMLDLALASPGEPVPLRDVAQRQEISDKYLEQIVTPLSRAGLVRSVRGAGGGYLLTRRPVRVHRGGDPAASGGEPCTGELCRRQRVLRPRRPMRHAGGLAGDPKGGVRRSGPYHTGGSGGTPPPEIPSSDGSGPVVIQPVGGSGCSPVFFLFTS